MSNNTVAGVFGDILMLVLTPPQRSPRELALRILEQSESYDFNISDLDIDDLLAEHDLVRQRWNKRWGEWDTVYAHEDGFDAAKPYISDREDQP